MQQFFCALAANAVLHSCIGHRINAKKTGSDEPVNIEVVAGAGIEPATGGL